MACSTCNSICCIHRSSTVGMPRSLTPPLGLGISTRRTGLGTYVPARSLARMASQCLRTWSRSSCVLMPSMPGAPPLRVTASQATVALSCVTTLSINSSCIAFCGESRVQLLLVVHSRGLRRLLRLGLGWPDRGGDRSCHAPPFRTALEVPSRFSLSSALSFFGPSLGPPFCSCEPQTLLWPLLTPRRLSAPGPPRVRVCSFRSRLWALQNAISGSWASWFLAHSPPTSCLTAHLCSFGRTFAFHPFAPPPCGDDLAVRLRLAPQAPGGNLSSRQTRHLPSTRARTSSSAAFKPNIENFAYSSLFAIGAFGERALPINFWNSGPSASA